MEGKLMIALLNFRFFGRGDMMHVQQGVFEEEPQAEETKQKM